MVPTSTAFVLASASPRRRELLSRAGLHPEVVPSDVDESVFPGENAVVYAVRVASEKARVGPSGAHILAADTVVALNGEILGKPRDAGEAAETLARLSGREHEVHTAVAFRRPGAEPTSFVVTTKVRFRTLTRSEIEAYVDTGEPLDKAGAYGVQGHGGALTASLHGSYTNVVGLPLEETLQLLDAEGLR